MKLPAAPVDWTYVQVETGFAADAVIADLVAGGGASLPVIESDRWLPGVCVYCQDPEAVLLSDLQSGDWLHVTDVTGDQITFVRTSTARVVADGEYIFISLGAYQWSVIMQKIEDLETLVARLSGNYDRVPQYGADGAPDELKVIEDTPPSMKVLVKAGSAIIDGQAYRLREDTLTPTITAPVTNNRIDLVQGVLGVQGALDSISVKTGQENVSPSPPTVDSGAIALATILLTPSTTTIEDADITDVRER
jgi:hypothetical protein